MKYLKYNALKKYGEGLLDRRACLLILLAEAKLSNRIAVIPKFHLGAQHNHGNKIASYLVHTYFEIDKLGVEYMLEEDFLPKEKALDQADILNIQDEKFDKNSDKTLVVRNLQDDNFWKLTKLHDVLHLAKNYHGVGVKFVIPFVTAPQHIKEVGDRILGRLERPVIGMHLRRGDRLNKKLGESMDENIIIDKLDTFSYNSVFYCSNDQKYRINHPKYFSISRFRDLVEGIKDNYLLFCIEMYVVDNCDISVRTFKDSSPFYFIEDQSNKNYSLCTYSMHGSISRFKNIPGELVKCDYVSYSLNNGKEFVKRGITLPRAINGVRRMFRRLVNM